MKRFTFDLEKLLTIRAHREREAEITLGQAVGALTLIENRLKALAEERAGAAAKRFSHSLAPAELLAFDRYIQRLDVTKERLLKEAAEAELKVEEARKVFIEASRERKILDKLKERGRRDHHKLFLTEEIKAVDDIASGAAARKAAVEGAVN